MNRTHNTAYTLGDKYVLLGEHLNWHRELPAEFVSDIGDAGLEIHLARRDQGMLSAWAETLTDVRWTASIVGADEPAGFWMVSARGQLGNLPVHVWTTLDLDDADTADTAIHAIFRAGNAAAGAR